MKKLTVGVVIPLYNYEDYIAKALRSVVNQTYKIEQIVVVDDCSTDNSYEAALEFSKRYDNIVVVKKEKNAGESDSRNVALGYVSTDLVAFLDADDIWHEQKIELQVDKLLEDQADLVYSEYCWIDNNEKLLEDRGIVSPSLRGKVFNELLYANLISGSASAVLVYKKFIDEVGLFDTELKFGADWDYWLRLSQVCKFSYCGEVLVSLLAKEGFVADIDYHINVAWHHFLIYSKYKEFVSVREDIISKTRSEFLNVKNISIDRFNELVSSCYDRDPVLTSLIFRDSDS